MHEQDRAAVVVEFAPALVLASAAVSAQDAGNYQLPPAPSQTATAQGPVVPDAPPPRPVPTLPALPQGPAVNIPAPVITGPSPTPLPSASPQIVRRSVPRPTPAPVQTPASATGPEPQPEPPTTPVPPEFSAVPGPALENPKNLKNPPVASTNPEQDAGVPWIWIGSGLIAIILTSGLLIRRKATRKKPSAPVGPPLLHRSATAPKAVPEADTTIVIADLTPPLTLEFIATRMSASLLNATLAYRIVLHSAEELGSVTVRADMTSAHASRPAEEQLGHSDAPVIHTVDCIGAGEDVEFTGEIRLPLSAITPIRQGQAALFIPLVRIAVDGSTAQGPAALRTAFVIGLHEAPSAQRLRPFRLDLGPRNYSDISQRALDVPAFA